MNLSNAVGCGNKSICTNDSTNSAIVPLYAKIGGDREDLIEIPDNLLSGLDCYSYRIYAHVARKTDYPKSLQEIRSHCQIAKQVVMRSLNQLLKIGLIETYRFDGEQVCEILCQKHPQDLSIGKHICSWCKSKTITLHSHHYPLPQKLNGKEVVQICANCHFEFHQLTDVDYYRVKRGDRVCL